MAEENTAIKDGASSWFSFDVNSAFDKIVGAGLQYLDYDTQKTQAEAQAATNQNQAFAAGTTYPVTNSGQNALYGASSMNTWLMVGGAALLGLIALKVVK